VWSSENDQFRRILTELGRDSLSRDDALRLHFGVYAQQISEGEVSPMEGVRRMFPDAREEDWDADHGVRDEFNLFYRRRPTR
jgi:hypothetical protein